MTVRHFFVLLLGALAAAGLGPAGAQDYPTRPVRVIVGASPEATPRLLADALQKRLGQPFVVEQRGGAGGDIAAKAVAAAEPDGHTLLYASSNYALATAMQLGSFDFSKDFLPIALVGTSAYVLVAHPSVEAKSVPELIALAKAKPGSLNCGSSGIATPGHLSCEMFKSMAGIDIVHVPFRDANNLMNGMLGGQVQMSFAVSTAARGQLQSGALRGLAVTTESESPLVPGLPPLHTFGLPGFVVTGWGSFMAAPGTPRAVIDTLNRNIVETLQEPEISQKLLNFGLQPAPAWSPEQFGEFVQSEIARWNRAIDIGRVPRGRAQGG